MVKLRRQARVGRQGHQIDVAHAPKLRNGFIQHPGRHCATRQQHVGQMPAAVTMLGEHLQHDMRLHQPVLHQLRRQLLHSWPGQNHWVRRSDAGQETMDLAQWGDGHHSSGQPAKIAPEGLMLD